LTGQKSNNTKRESPPKTNPSFLHFNIPPFFIRRIWRKIPLGIHKLFLSLLVIAGLVDIIRRGYELFTHHTEPLKNTIIFLVEFAIWIWIITVLRKRRYKYRKPKFKVILISVVAIVLVCAFAGIDPMSSYKDKIFSAISTTLEERQAISEAAKIAEAEKLAEEEARTKSEELAAEETRIKSEALARVEAERKAKEEALAAAEQKVKKISEMERNVVELVNGLRTSRNSNPLIWDDRLYAYSRKHSEDMAIQQRMFHTSMNEPYAENAWWGGGTRWTATDIVESWMSSPKHRTWLLCPRLKHIAVGIASSTGGTYASWTFWRSEPAYEDWWYQESTDPPDWWY